MTAVIDACAACLRRTELIGWLSGHIEQQWRLRRGRPQLLALPDEELLRWADRPEVAARYRAFSSAFATDRLIATGVGAVCGCSDAYPAGLRELPDPPAVLHLLGDPGRIHDDAVALVGARQASPYGLEVARSLGRSLGAAGVTVTSGMAKGVDSAAHAGALETGHTVAVLATGADRPYPANAAGLHRRIVANGCVVSELPPGTAPRRWAFPARNRLIAALSLGTVVVEGGERSGSLITADFAAELGRFVGAVPGPVTSRGSAGSHALLKVGAEVIRGPEDILDLLSGAAATVGSVVIGSGPRLAPRPEPAPPPPDLTPDLRALLDRVERGAGSLAELTTDPADGLAVAAGLGELELRGLVRRVFGGRYIRALA
ncbi:MAG: processing protein [Solirubrobacteraceae bacterium]|jgi:DNA processing protein|nr:processing protein [Solirubrobacteraceae bacterium]